MTKSESTVEGGDSNNTSSSDSTDGRHDSTAGSADNQLSSSKSADKKAAGADDTKNNNDDGAVDDGKNQATDEQAPIIDEDKSKQSKQEMKPSTDDKDRKGGEANCSATATETDKGECEDGNSNSNNATSDPAKASAKSSTPSDNDEKNESFSKSDGEGKDTNQTEAKHQNHQSESAKPTTPNNVDTSNAAETSNKQQPSQSATNPQPNSNKQSLSKEQDFDYQDQYSDKNDTLLGMSFNQDGGCLAVGTASGFRICNVYPFQETNRRNLGFQQQQQQQPSSLDGDGGGAGGSGGGGIARIEMLYRTNLMALTGHHSTASHSQYPPNKVLIYDDHYQRNVGQITFRQKVLVTKLRRDRIVVVLRDRVYVYNFVDFSVLDKIHTGDNPGGLIGLSLDNWGVGGGSGNGDGGERASDVLGVANNNNNNCGGGARNGLVLACPSTQRGQVRVELYGLRRTTFVDAHESALGALALSVDGSLLATASERGTVIRLYDTRGVTVGGGRASANTSSSSTTSVSSSIPLKEFRRGVERATISCLTFSLDSCWLGCASDHGTVHIFQAQTNSSNSVNGASSKTNNSSESSTKPRSSSMTGKAMRMLPKLVSSPKKFLMDGEHSYAQVRGVPHPHTCAFVPDRDCTIAVAGTDDYDNGVLLLAEFGNRDFTSATGTAAAANNGGSRAGSSGSVEDSTEARRLGYHRFFKKGGAASMHGGRNRRSAKRSKEGNKLFSDDIVEGGAYIDDSTSVNLRMNHIRIGDENEDDFVPIDYDMKK